MILMILIIIICTIVTCMHSIISTESAHLDQRLCVLGEPHEAVHGDHEDLDNDDDDDDVEGGDDDDDDDEGEYDDDEGEYDNDDGIPFQWIQCRAKLILIFTASLKNFSTAL